MFYLLAKITGLFALPGMVLLIAFVGGATLLWWPRHRRAGRVVVTAAAVVFAVIALSPVSSVATRRLEDRFPPNPPLAETVDGIIVLGGALDEMVSAARGQITLNDAAGRLIEAARLARVHREAKVLVTGGNADPLAVDGLDEARFMAQLLVDLGVERNRILIEDKSRTTWENAVFSYRMATPAPSEHWLLVTSARHMARSVGAFRKAGWSVTAWPTDFVTGGPPQWVNEDLPFRNLGLLSQSLHEWIGLVVYRLLGRSDSLFPAP